MNKRRRHKAKARRRWWKRENDFASVRGWSRHPDDRWANEEAPVMVGVDWGKDDSRSVVVASPELGISLRPLKQWTPDTDLMLRLDGLDIHLLRERMAAHARLGVIPSVS